jgi:hypothetical protein
LNDLKRTRSFACAAAGNRSSRDDSIIGSTLMVMISDFAHLATTSIQSAADLHREFSTRGDGLQNPSLAICRPRVAFAVLPREPLVNLAPRASARSRKVALSVFASSRATPTTP